MFEKCTLLRLEARKSAINCTMAQKAIHEVPVDGKRLLSQWLPKAWSEEALNGTDVMPLETAHGRHPVAHPSARAHPPHPPTQKERGERRERER
jgi:hypothetical protein